MMSDSSLYFKLYSNCIPVRGAKRSVICDLQMMRYKYIPDLLLEIIEKSKTLPILDVKATYGNEMDKGIDAYFEKLVKEEWGMFTDMPNSFPDLDLTWEYPGTIANGIIDINKESPEFDFKDIFDQLSHLGCTALQLRFFDEVDLERVNSIMNQARNSIFEYVELILNYTPKLTEANLTELFKKNLRIRNILVTGAPENREIIFEELTENVSILYSTEHVKDKHYCGIVNSGYFEVNLDLFSESQKHNTCLNRKIAIDIDGSIKNCPSLPGTYGNIKTTSLKEVVEKEQFRKYWNINKDQIEVCRDCEFRYMCTDCRAYLVDDKNLLSKPLKCNYDPYKAEWI